MPSPLTTTFAGLLTDCDGVVAPSSSHSTCSMPDPGAASVPPTATVTGAVCQPPGVLVVSVGRTVSILTCWVFHVVQPPGEPSVTRVLRMWSPSLAMVTVLLFGPLPVTAPLSTSH